MKQHLLFGLLGLLLLGCQGEEVPEFPENNSGTANAVVGLIELCHWDAATQTFELIAVPQQAVQPHLNHGDALVDADGDGYSAVGSCTGSADDCDDNDPSVYPGNGCDTILVIAYSNLNGEAGFQEGSADVLISKLVDFNNDGVASVGDKVITNQYPKDFVGATFGNFTVKEHSVTVVFGASVGSVEVICGNRNVFNWNKFSVIELYIEEAFINNEYRTTVIEDAYNNASGIPDYLIMDPLSPSQPAESLSIDIYSSDRSDDNFLDVDFFL